MSGRVGVRGAKVSTPAVIVRAVAASGFGDYCARVAGDVVQAGWNRVVRYGAIGPQHRHARRFARFGPGSMIAFPPTVLFGEERIEIGAATTIGPLATLSAGFPSQIGIDGDPVITIGDRTMLGKGIGIVGHERIEIGDDIWTGHYVYVTDQNHGYEDLDLPIGTQLWKNDPVSIGSGSWLGHGAVVLPGTRIGRHVVVAAGAVVAGLDVPDRSVVAGVPARVIKRYVEGEGWVSPT
ncbi:MAG: putative sugar acetyltransferase [Actinomycetia bacterium]|nr:putative sugar acetyltransferase [Actinomycetes bacterium]